MLESILRRYGVVIHFGPDFRPEVRRIFGKIFGRQCLPMTNHGQPWLTKTIEKQSKICFKIYPKIDQKSSKNDPKIDQKSIQKRSKIDPKSVLERVSPSKPFLDRFRWHFGSNLEPSWGARWSHVGAMLDKKNIFWRCLKAFKNDHHFQHHSGPSWGRF